MEKTITVTRSELVKIFDTWDKQADANNWNDKPWNPGAQADHLIHLVEEMQSEAASK
jgi:hypothetical protein